MTPTIVSFYTRGNDGDYYGQHAERLRLECEALGLRVWLKEVQLVGRPWIEMLRMKPLVILEALEAVQGPVLWIDVDGSVLKEPEGLADMDFMAVPKPPNHPRPFFMGCSFWNCTAGARAFLRFWSEEYETEGSEELAFKRAFERAAGFLRWAPLPEGYMHIEGHAPTSGETVVLHRISKGPSKAEFLAQRRKQNVSLTAVTVLKSGGCFTPEWVWRINRQIRQHLAPDRLVCLTDVDLGRESQSGDLKFENRDSGCVSLPLVHDWPGWFSKLELFRPGLFDGPVVYFDLDTLLVKALPEFRPAEPRRLTMLTDFYNPDQPASGMMLWDGTRYGHIYEKFAAKPRFAEGMENSDGAIIGKHCVERIQDIWPGLAGSYKADKLQSGPKDFGVVCFHGKPKQHQVDENSWVRAAWCGGTT